jgi:aspartate/methionine/tyrosine aminotransferase
MPNPAALPHARRMRDIEPFHVLALLARARALEAEGRTIVHMEIGEPDFPSPKPVIEAAIEALSKGDVHYTPALGLPQLREAIARFYRSRYGVAISPRRVIVTPGASGAFLLVMAAVVGPKDQVLVGDPSYPCNRHFVRVMEGEPLAIPVGAESGYQFTAEHVRQNWSERTAAVLLASPSNPTGTLIGRTTLAEIFAQTQAHGAALIVDEIYHGLVYEGESQTALALSDDVFVINSFSKYFNMTGWRLGWLVAPEQYLDDIEKLAQNLFLAASTPAQFAALAAFAPETISILEGRREKFRARRDYLVPALIELGFEIPVVPQGAFYVYANCQRLTSDSFDFASSLLEEAGVAITPGADFGAHAASSHVRFAYTTSAASLREGVRRLREYLS